MPLAMVMFGRITLDVAHFAAGLFVVKMKGVLKVTVSVLKDQKQEYTQTDEE
jgi:hypothetical protein